MLRVAGELTDGTILWMANARAVETHVAPRINKAAADAGRAAPRIVCGLARRGHRRRSRGPQRRGSDLRRLRRAAELPSHPRHRRLRPTGDAAIVGDEASVTKQINALADAGVTDFWAAPFPVGADKKASRLRTNDLLKTLLA